MAAPPDSNQLDAAGQMKAAVMPSILAFAEEASAFISLLMTLIVVHFGLLLLLKIDFSPEIGHTMVVVDDYIIFVTLVIFLCFGLFRYLWKTFRSVVKMIKVPS